MFGELIGLWLADMWIRAGRPDRPLYVELGPGARHARARCAAGDEALRARARRCISSKARPSCKRLQLEAVPQAQFHADLSTVPMDGPMLLVANEFLDALPVRQLVMTAGGLARGHGRDSTRPAGSCRVAGRQPMDAAVPEARREAEVGTVIETCPGAAAVMFEAAGRLAEQGGAALFIDYGYDRAAHRLDAAGGARRTARSIRSPRRARPTSPRTSISPRWPTSPARAARSGSAPCRKAPGCARSASRRAPKRSPSSPRSTAKR